MARRGAERRRGDPQRRDHRRPAARRHELPELRRPDAARGVLAAERGASAASATRAGRSACRSPAATSRSTTSRRRARSRRRRRSASSGCSRTSRGRSDRRSRAAGDTVAARRRGDAGPRAAASTRALAGLAAEDGPPALDLAREAALQAFAREAAARGLLASAQDVSGGGLAVALAECGHLGGRRSRARRVAPAAGRELAGRRPVRREPVAARRLGRPRHAPGARPARPPARPAGRGARRRSAASGSVDRARAGRGAPGAAEDRGSRVADALDVGLDELRHAWEHGLSRALGWETRLMCGVFGVVLPGRSAARGGGARLARALRAPAPRPGVGRRRGQRRRAADALQGPRDDRLGPRRAAAARRSGATSRSPTAATRRPARRSGRTPSRRSGSGRAGRSRSATTATS